MGRRFCRKRSSSTMRFLRRTATNPCSPLTVHLGPTRGAGRTSFPGWIGFFEGQEPPLRPSKNASTATPKVLWWTVQDLNACVFDPMPPTALLDSSRCSVSCESNPNCWLVSACLFSSQLAMVTHVFVS